MRTSKEIQAVKPESVKRAEIAIWATIAISALGVLANRRMGLATDEQFIGSLIGYALICIFPYKIGRGSNAARYFYVVTMVCGLLFVFAGVDLKMTKADVVASIISAPITALSVYWLFVQDAREWFAMPR